MNYTVLYRKYRPKKFSDIVGQESIVNILTNQIKSEKISHAYLFCGIRGTGKTSTAKIFAKAICCLNNTDNGEPCNECVSCKSINEGSSSDIIEIDAASNRSIDGIRALKEEVNLMPVFGKYKVYIIDEIHMLTTEAFNALLKTLEEPPSHVVFIFATTEVNKVLPTILSRCQRFDFSRISKEEIVKHLSNILDELNIEYETSAIEEIALSSEGALRDALSTLDKAINVSSEEKVTLDLVRDVLGLARKEQLYKICDNLLDGDIDSVLVALNDVIASGKETDSVLMQIIEYFRDKILAINVNEPSNILAKSTEYINKLTENHNDEDTSKKICDILIKLSKLKNDMRFFSNPQYLLEAKLIELCLPDDEISYMPIQSDKPKMDNTSAGTKINTKEIQFLNEKINSLEKSIALLESKLKDGSFSATPDFDNMQSSNNNSKQEDLSSFSLEDGERIRAKEEFVPSEYPNVKVEDGVIMVEENEVKEISNLFKKCSQYITNRHRDPLIAQMVNVLKPVAYKDGVVTVVFTNYYNLILTFNELGGRELLSDTIKQLYDNDLKIVYMKGKHEVRFRRDKNRKSRLGDEIKKSLEEENKNIIKEKDNENNDLGSLSFDVSKAASNKIENVEEISEEDEYLASFTEQDMPILDDAEFAEEDSFLSGFTEMED